MNLESFVFAKLTDGGFAQIAKIPSGKAMDFQFPHQATLIKVTNRATHWLFECYANNTLRGTLTLNRKNLLKSLAPLLGSAGGASRSPTKASAARMNGKKGGRPKKGS